MPTPNTHPPRLPFPSMISHRCGYRITLLHTGKHSPHLSHHDYDDFSFFFFFNNFFISLELAIVSIYHLLGFLCHYLYFNSNCNPKTKNSEQFHLARLIIHFAINPGTSLHLSPWKPLFSLSCVIAFFNLLHFVGAYPVVAS